VHISRVFIEFSLNSLLLAIYKGTVNDPTSFPPPSRTHGSYHWSFERLLSAGLIPITGAAFVTSSSSFPMLDGILGVALIMHSHIGVRLIIGLLFAVHNPSLAV
jgi:succinate dehydrogenase (ubiquinone) membrane anchor subunit